MSEKKRTVTLKGWCAVTDYGKGKILSGGEGPFYAKRPFKWSDDTRWVRATAIVTLHPRKSPRSLP